jgi:hypothetical protein
MSKLKAAISYHPEQHSNLPESNYFLYHRLLGEIAAGELNFSAFLARYGLNPKARLSDASWLRLETFTMSSSMTVNRMVKAYPPPQSH